MDYTPLSGISSSSFGEMLSMIFYDRSAITLTTLASLSILCMGYLAFGEFKKKDKGGVTLFSFAALIMGTLILGGSILMGYVGFNYDTALDNIQEKYNIEKLADFGPESNLNEWVYSGIYYDLDDKTKASLSIVFDKKTGEPTILTNSQVSADFVKSLEKTQ